MNSNSLPKLDLASLPGADNITRVTLDNGITVLTRENANSPAVVINGFLMAGAINVDKAQAGLAEFTASMLMRGTQTRDFAAIFEELESVGAGFGVGANTHTVGFSGKALAEDLGMLLELGSDVLRNPAFPADHIERLRGETMAGLARRAHDTRSMADMRFDELLFGADHPYGIASGGTAETVQAIMRDDLVAYHDKFYGPRDMAIVIVGAVKPQDAIALVEKHFGDWQNPNQPPTAVCPPIAKLESKVEDRIVMDGKTQSDIVLGFLGPERNHPQYRAVMLTNTIFGRFGMMGRLGEVIRNKQGLAYYSYSSASGGFGPGAWNIYAGINPENVQRAIDSMLHEATRLVTELVTEEEIADSKSYLIGGMPLSLERNEGVASRLMTIQLFGHDLDYLRKVPNEIAALTREDLLEASKMFIDPEIYALAVAGPA